jgi:hypothetical protein
MARSIQTIYDEIIAEKNNNAALNGLQPNIDDSQTLLDDLNTTSKVAIWRLWAFVIAVAINIHENVWDLFRAEIETRAEEVPTGTPLWYHNEALKFQYGYSLEWSGTQYNYPTLDEVAQIVKLVAVVDAGFQVRIKAAKLDGSGNPEALSGAELSAFQGYILKIKFAGTATSITSGPADDLKVDYFIQYDPLLLAPDGSLLTDPSTFPVKDAINAYAEGLPFNGVLSLMALTDAVQQAQGVKDVTLNDAQAKFGALSYSSINKQYTPDAGYLLLDEINSVITYSTINV